MFKKILVPISIVLLVIASVIISYSFKNKNYSYKNTTSKEVASVTVVTTTANPASSNADNFPEEKTATYVSSTKNKILLAHSQSGKIDSEAVGTDYLFILKNDGTLIYKKITGGLGGQEKEIYSGRYLLKDDKIILDLDKDYIVQIISEDNKIVSSSIKNEGGKKITLSYVGKIGGYVDDYLQGFVDDENYVAEGSYFELKAQKKMEDDFYNKNILPTSSNDNVDLIGYFVFVDKFIEY